jgi:aldose 1-epimerase
MPDGSAMQDLDIVTLTRPRPSGLDRPVFLSAEVLPGRGMMTFQITAHLPGRGEIDLLHAPSLDEARKDFAAAKDFPGNPSFSFGGAILLPFANRIRGTLAPDGETIAAETPAGTVHLPANWGGRKPGAERYAMHGLVLASSMDDIRRESTAEEDRVTAVLHAGDFGGHWTSETEVTFEYALRSDALRWTVTAKNAGRGRLPMGIGWHPYFALPSRHREQARLHLPARERTLVNDYDEVLPTGEVVPVAGTPYDFTAPGGKPLGSLYLDDCFVGLERTREGEVVAEVVDPEASYGLRVVGASPHIQALQVYGPPDQGFIVLEPQFNRADPFGAEWGPGVETGMVILEPGESAVYAARLELFVP